MKQQTHRETGDRNGRSGVGITFRRDVPSLPSPRGHVSPFWLWKKPVGQLAPKALLSPEEASSSLLPGLATADAATCHKLGFSKPWLTVSSEQVTWGSVKPQMCRWQGG